MYKKINLYIIYFSINNIELSDYYSLNDFNSKTKNKDEEEYDSKN